MRTWLEGPAEAEGKRMCVLSGGGEEWIEHLVDHLDQGLVRCELVVQGSWPWQRSGRRRMQSYDGLKRQRRRVHQQQQLKSFQREGM